MRTLYASAALLAATSFVGANAGVVTAEFLPGGLAPNGYLIGVSANQGLNTKFGQSFLATTSGAFESLHIGSLYHGNSGNVLRQSLQIRIYDVTDTSGLTSGAPIGGWDVPASEIPLEVFPYSPTFQYTGPTINIIAGRQYAFLLGTQNSGVFPFVGAYNIGSHFADPGYLAGEVVTLHAANSPQVDSFQDIPFQVTVVPAPAGLAAFGVLAIAGVARRRR